MTPHIMPRRSRPAAAGYLLMLGLLALMGPSCDKMPLMAPSSSTLTLYAARVAVGLNGAVDVTATVIESAGTPVQNGTVVSFTTTLGAIDPFEARTNDGKVTVKFNSGTQSGTAEIRASSGGNTVKDALKISVGAAAAAKVELLANPTALSASGGTVQLTALVSDASGNRLGGVPVSFSTDAGFLGESSVTTDALGEARTPLSTTSTASVVATVVGGTAGSIKSDPVKIPVRVGPTISISATGTGVPGAVTTFAVTVTVATNGAVVRSASISFGDGSSQSIGTAGTSSIQHVYTSSGTYTVTATAIDVAGEVATATSSVSMQNVVVTVTLNQTPLSPDTVTPTDFFSTATVTPSGTVERYEWDFGDKKGVRTTSSGETSYLYTTTGLMTVTVRAVTTTGASGIAKKDIVVVK
jgi:hypothetical protein